MKLEEAIKSSRFVSEKQKATLNIMHSAYWLRTSLADAVKPLDISMEQHNVMRILLGKNPEQMCVKDIGSRMLEKSSNVPRIIDKLVEKKLAKRVPSKEDKRETLVSLTEKGISVIQQAKEQIDAATAELIQLDDSEAQTLSMLLDKMRG